MEKIRGKLDGYSVQDGRAIPTERKSGKLFPTIKEKGIVPSRR